MTDSGYLPDDGELSEADRLRLREAARSQLPQGPVLSRKTLPGLEGLLETQEASDKLPTAKPNKAR